LRVTGTPGKYLRFNAEGELAEADGRINVRDFGAVGDNATDDSAAFVAAIAHARSLGIANHGYSHSASPTLFVPAGVYYLGSTTLDFECCLIFEGETGSGPAGGSTTLRWDDGVTGLRFQFANTSGADGVKPLDLTATATGSLVRNLRLEGARSDALDDGVSFGIHMRAPITVRDVMIQGFGSNGVQIKCGFGGGGAFEGNGNTFYLERLWIEGCYHGVHCEGADSNAGTGMAINCMSNQGWGISDSSFLGNTWVSCHTATNTFGPFTATGENARSVFLGCYTEPDMPPAIVRSPSMVIGGHQGAGVNGNLAGSRPWLGSVYDALCAQGDFIVEKEVAAASYRIFGADEAYGPGWNGSLHLPSRNAVFDKIEAMSARTAELEQRVMNLELSLSLTGGGGSPSLPALGGTSLLEFTQQLGNAAWGASGISVVSNDAVAPDGTTTADKIVESAANARHDFAQLELADGSFTTSVYAKAAGRRYAFILLYIGTNSTAQALFDLQTGTALAITDSSAVLSSISNYAVEAPNGYTRLVVTFTTAGAQSIYFALGLSDSATPSYNTDGNYPYLGDGTSGVHAWQFQLISGTDATGGPLAVNP
jgi:hypothetical protein